jgi:hypothetical protein
MPRGTGVDLLPVALTAAQALADVGHEDGLRQGVDDNVGLVVAGFAGCGDGAHAVLAHVGERHGRAGRGAHGLGGNRGSASKWEHWLLIPFKRGVLARAIFLFTARDNSQRIIGKRSLQFECLRRVGQKPLIFLICAKRSARLMVDASGVVAVI